MKKILLIETWISKLPDYYEFHKKTITKQNEIFDIYFFTDQEVDTSDLPSNYHIININLEDLKDRFYKANNRKLKLPGGARKITDLKFSYFVSMFDDIIDYSQYDYFGIFDIDTLMGDLYNWVKPYLGEYDFISTGGENFHNRLGGPFLIFKNDPEILAQFQTEKYYNIFNTEEIYGIGEKDLNVWANQNKKVKILTHSQNLEETTGKVLYDAIWSGGKVYCNEEEKMLHHFYHKPETTFSLKGNTITSEYKKDLIEDFYWVTYFTENYESIIEGLIESIKKYSNRKCIFYTINYDSDLRFKLGKQFIFRRLDIEPGEIDPQGRDNNIISCKPKVLLDSIDFIPNSKFIFIDTDVYLTNVADNLNKYFNKLENFPLFNSHIHDRLYANDILKSGEWVSPIDILSKATNIPVRVFPRRKTNIILYDNRSKWFFDEQIEIYNQYKNTEPGIFRLHDEDSANILLSKYNFQTSLPLMDMEESSTLKLEKFENYSYNRSVISEFVKLPKTLNDLFIFHGFKDLKYYKDIDKNYGKTVLDTQDLVVRYKSSKITFTKNNFLVNKQIENNVCFKIYDKDYNLLYSLNNQKLFNYWVFFLDNVFLDDKQINIEIEESTSKRIIYKSSFKF